MKCLLVAILCLNAASAAVLVKKRVHPNRVEYISAKMVEKNISKKITLKDIRESISEKIATPNIQYVEELIPNSQVNKEIQILFFQHL